MSVKSVTSLLPIKGKCPSCSIYKKGLKNHVNKSQECYSKLLNDYLAKK